MADLSPQRSNSLAGPSSGTAACPAAAMCVLPDAAKLSFRGSDSSIAAAGVAFGVALPRTACRFHASGDRTACWLGPDEWLLTAVGEPPETVFAAMAHALSGHACSLVDVSHRSDALAVKGPMSEYVLNHGCPLDLSLRAFPVGMCTRTLLGKAQIVLSRRSAEEFHLDVFRSFAPYVWQLLDEARRELI
jgi:sarcosine oxidase subunit gamma